jgi:hypothetical protein
MHPSTAEPRAEQAPMHDRILRPLPAAVTANAADCESAALPLSSVGPRGGVAPPNRSFETTPSGDGAIHAVPPPRAALYCFAGVRSRRDSPSAAELEAQGWTVEHTDERYGTKLMRKDENGKC